MATTKTTKKDAIVSNDKAVETPKKASVILGARITEKAATGAEKGRYTFNVDPSTNKSEIAKAIKAQYKVTPVKINITLRKEKQVFLRGKKGVKQGGKKAVVYLKKGDKIEFV